MVSKLISKKKNKDQNAKESFFSPSMTSTSSVSTPSASSSTPVSEPIPDVHPSLVEYLSLFPPAQYSQDFQQPAAENVYQQPMAEQSAPPPPSSIPYGYDQAFFDEAMSLPLPDRSSYFVDPDTPPKDLSDLGMMMAGDSGIDEQWKAFMKKSFSGLLDENISVSPATGF